MIALWTPRPPTCALADIKRIASAIRDNRASCGACRPHGDCGQAAVEFVLVLPLLVLIVFGMLDLGRAFTTHLALANAAREGARYCALSPGDTAGTRMRVADELGGRMAPDTASIQCPVLPKGQPVTIIVRAGFVPVTPLISSLTRGPIMLGAPATMVVW